MTGRDINMIDPFFAVFSSLHIITFKMRNTLLYLVGLLCFTLSASPIAAQGNYLDWSQEVDLPVNEAGKPFALKGMFSGVHNGVLILAGGSLDSKNLAVPVESGFSSKVFVGSQDDVGKISWEEKSDQELALPISYGLSISTPDGVLCIGGIGEGGPSNRVRLLSWNSKGKKVGIQSLQALPIPLVRGAGALLGNTVYVAGQDKGENRFFSLDISNLDAASTWESLPVWPGPARLLASAGVQSDGTGAGFYLFGGTTLGEFGQVIPLNDGYRYDPKSESWKPIAEIAVDGKPYYPRVAPVIHSGVHHLLLFGADDPTSSTEYRREVLAYHTITNTWAVADTSPEMLPIGISANWWNGNIVLPGGESPSGEALSSVWQVIPISAPSGLRWLDYVVIILYLVILVWMGAHFMKRGKTTEDYFKAGKRIPWWAAGISIFGTSLSAITYMAVPAKAYSTDWLYFFLSMSQILTVPLVIWMVLPFFRRLNVTTAYEYLERRFHVAVRLVGGLAFLLFQFGRIGIVLFLPAIALSVVTGIDIYTCIIVMAVLSIFYTVLGGIEAVIWTDVKQVVVLTVGAIVCLVMMASGVDGGFDSLIDIAGGDGKMRLVDLDFNFNNPTLWVILGGGIGTNLINQTSDQTFVQRYLTTKDEKSAARSLLTPAVLVLPVSLLFFGLGTALYSFYKTNPEALNPVMENADAIFPWYIVSQLPQGLSGLLIAGIFAASMSSLDSSLNSAATVITVDFYKRYNSNKSDQDYLKFARIMTVVIGIAGMGFALLLAGAEIKSLWDEFSKILGLFAGGLAGLFLLGMSSRRATTGGALIGFVVSAGIQYWVSSTGAVHFLLYTLTGLASCYVVGWVASWLFPKRSDLKGLTVGSIREVKEE